VKPWPFKSMGWKDVTPAQFAAKLGVHLMESIGDVMHEGDVIKAKQLLQLIGKHVREEIAPLRERIAQLEADMAERKYFSVWEPGPYKRHNAVTYKGSLWICLADTHSAPGTSESWQLAVKKGRDARGT
jgi:hypothetical protein